MNRAPPRALATPTPSSEAFYEAERERLQTRAWSVCCDFHDRPNEIEAHLREWGREYGRTKGGVLIEPPPGWQILPYRQVVPRHHREFQERHGWLGERLGHSTMTPIFARPAGWVRAFAVPVTPGTVTPPADAPSPPAPAAPPAL